MLRVKKLYPDAKLPVRASGNAAGYDVFARLSEPAVIYPLSRLVIPTGIAIEMPKDYFAYMASRSGLAVKHGLSLLASIVDNDYRGEIHVIVSNNSRKPFVIENGHRIAQIVLIKHATLEVEEVSQLSHTIRGEKRFGSTGMESI